jgi:hypothetical protein
LTSDVRPAFANAAAAMAAARSPIVADPGAPGAWSGQAQGVSFEGEPMPTENIQQIQEASAASQMAIATAPGFKAAYFALPRPVTSLSQVDFTATPTATGSKLELNILNSDIPFWSGGPRGNFAALYDATLNVANGGRYTFHLTSDDGSALFVDGVRVINNNRVQSSTERRVTLDLAAGDHMIEVRYFELTGQQSLRLEWRGPDSGGVRQVLSGPALSHDTPPPNAAPVAADDVATVNAGASVLIGVRANDVDPNGDALVVQSVGAPAHGAAMIENGQIRYTPAAGFSGTDTFVYVVADGRGGRDEALVRVSVTPADPGLPAAHARGLRAEYFVLSSGVSSLEEVAFARTPDATGMVGSLEMRGGAAFWEGGPEDSFAARYTGALNVVEAGRYMLYLSSDDGSELYLDGVRVIENNGLHATTERSVALDLSTGAHNLEIRYFEASGDQTLALDWQGPDSDGMRRPVSGASLSHDAGSGGEDPHDGHGGGGVLEPPQTAAEIDAFVARVMAEPDAHAHPDDSGMALDHARLLGLAPRSESTHVAVRNGEWFDPDTWHQGRIPGEDAKAFIPKGLTVTYDGQSAASLFTLRVDGELNFATDADTRMIIDTLVAAPSGRLEIGTAEAPVEAGVSTEILIADNGDINVGWDPSLLSRGIVSHGSVEIHGAEKTAFLKVAAAPMAGQSVIRLAEAPEGWRPGDALVLTGTHKQGWAADDRRGLIHRESQDEEVTIASIDGATVRLEQALRYNHDAPRADLAAYVSNMSRNVTVASENGADTAVHHRGHAMFMHSDDVDVRYAAFDDLGRTDKSRPAADVATFARIESDSNVKGRYSLHLHKTGTEDQEHPAIAVGNAVSGSPGWGFTHHSSHAEFTENVSFDVFGAGFAAEDGDETGIWLRNLAIRSEGIGYGDWTAKESGDVDRHDNGRTGDGFFFAGRLVEATENVAANTTNGFVWMHRSAPSQPLTKNLHQPEVGHGAEKVSVSTSVIQGFHDNEAFGTHTGIIVIKANPAQNHDVRTVLDGFTNWETAEGVNLSYTAHYTLKNIDLLYGSAFVHGAGTGVTIGDNAFDLVFNGVKARGFAVGANLDNIGTSFSTDDFENILIDADFTGVRTHYVGYNPARHRILTSDDLTPGRLGFEMRGDRVLSMEEDFRFDGTKSDSIGTRDRHFDGDRQVLGFNYEIADLLATDGYYRTADGRKVMLIEDFVADRATGELMKFAHVVTLQLSDSEIQNIWQTNQRGGPVYNGVITLGGSAPVVWNDSASTGFGRDITIDVLSNDRDPEGNTLRVDGLSDPIHGDVRLRDDGRLLYSPERGFSGVDSFNYWATDGNGNFSKAVVTIDVFDSLL